MFHETPQMASAIDAIDQLGEARLALEGLGEALVAVSEAGFVPKRSIELASYITDMCARTVASASDVLFDAVK